MPSPKPRCLAGNASVRIAALLAKRNEPPIAWTIRKPISSSAPVLPELGVRNSRSDPTVKMAKPRLYILTRPSISEIRPQVTNSVEVTTMYPIRIQSRKPVLPGVSGLILMPVKIVGRAIRTILEFSVAINIPSVVLERAIHL